MAKGTRREIITLACSECGDRNYTTTKNRRSAKGKLELKKFCKRSRTYTLHREVK
jgi:large subunit ribosomal protein L33